MTVEQLPIEQLDIPQVTRPPRQLMPRLMAVAAMGASLMAAGLAPPRVSAESTRPDQEAETVYDCTDLDPAADIPERTPALPDTDVRSLQNTLAVFGSPKPKDYCPEHLGRLVFVYVPGLTLPGQSEPTREDVQDVAQGAADLLRGATDDKVDFEVDVITAPESVAEEVRTHMQGNRGATISDDHTGGLQGVRMAGGPPCIDLNADYTPSKVAMRKMYDRLKSYRTVLGIGGTSCPITYMQDGQTVTSRAGGINYNGGRRIDMFPVGEGDYKPRDRANLIVTVAHELGHELGLHHNSALNCPQPVETIAAAGFVTKLDAVIRERLKSKKCTYTEYSSDGNPLDIMGEARPFIGPFLRGGDLETDAFAKDALTALQADVVSDRIPGMPGARTADLDWTLDATLVDRYMDGDEPFGAIMRLELPLSYALPGNSDPIVYSQVAFDYRTSEGFGTIDMYLTNLGDGDLVRQLYIGTIVAPDNSVTLVELGGRSWAIQNDARHPRQIRVQFFVPGMPKGAA